MDYLGQLEGPTTAAFGTGLYDFGYQPNQLPPAQAAGTASQLEAGGGGFDWNGALHDITGAWLAVESKKSNAEVPTNYRTNQQGQLYATDPAYRNGATLGGAVGAIGGIPTAWIVIGALIFGAVALSKEAG